MSKTLFFITLLFTLFTCKQPGEVDIYKAATFTDTGIQAVIEIPAGTNAKMEYNTTTEKIEIDQENGRDRIIDFLPYPGNYGFIPHTLMDTARGGDGDALDILVIAPHLETGTLLSVIPIAALLLRDGGELDTKIIAIPADSTLRVMPALDFRQFAMEYHGAKEIIQLWFLNYKGLGKMELLGWRDERYAMAEIKKWALKEVAQ